jgi:hypothetical protein
MERQLTDIKVSNLAEIFQINHRYSRFTRIINIFHKVRQNRKKQSFDLLFLKSKETPISQYLSRMFLKYMPRRFVADIRKIAVELKIRKDHVTKLVNKLMNFKKKIEIVLKYSALKKLTIGPMIRASKYTSAMKLITHACQKYHVRCMIKLLNIPTKAIFYRLDQKYFNSVK